MSGITGDLRTDRVTAGNDQTTAQNQYNSALNDINTRWTPHPSPPFKSVEEAQAAIASGKYNPTSGGNSPWGKENIGTVVTALNNAKAAVAALDEAISSLQSLDKLLGTGDIEGAVMLLQGTRAKMMDRQLGTQIKGMQDRNAQITKLNNDLTTAQTKLAAFSSTDTTDAKKAATKEVGDLKTAIDSLNSDSQIDMIRTQGLVNKRNEAFDTLTNLLGKFQKTIDGIVGNMR